MVSSDQELIKMMLANPDKWLTEEGLSIALKGVRSEGIFTGMEASFEYTYEAADALIRLIKIDRNMPKKLPYISIEYAEEVRDFANMWKHYAGACRDRPMKLS